MKYTAPEWLKESPLVIHTPSRKIFEPQRRIIVSASIPYLLDCCEQRYPLHWCDRLRSEHLRGVCLFITENQELTVFRLDSVSDRVAITDGHHKAIVEIPDLRPKTPERRAAESLAEFFAGELIESF
ncbi:hypothetical protein [Leptolyngbya ohadii]|uniref:hypothetical protein n=1 Tax=Leptolyngbya ohadii TaxID=1962290 RepID=UPI000B598F4C|nr:hypothetical protein [Leptolyngbya ohadii]